jgi:protein-S-isoprenylcysteine O-methyltransferase Ste14
MASALVLVGESVFFWSLRLAEYAAMVAVVLHLWVLVQEEPALRGKMGAAYDRYVQDVPRWIPRPARSR